MQFVVHSIVHGARDAFSECGAGFSGASPSVPLDTGRFETVNEANTRRLASGRPRLDANSVDAVYIMDAYHHFEFPAEMLAEIKRAMRPGIDDGFEFVEEVDLGELDSSSYALHFRLP